MARLDGKVAVILGAASRDNMGQVMARVFAREGARIMVAGRQEEPLRAIAAEIGGVHALCDITRKTDVEALAEATVNRFGKVDIAINCTGWGLLAKLLDTTEEQIDKLMDLQFKGPYFFLQGVRGAHGRGRWRLGHHGLVRLGARPAQQSCRVHRHQGQGAKRSYAVLRTNLVSAACASTRLRRGLTSTPMTEQAVHLPGLEEAFLKEYPLGRIGTTQDIANAALWLAGDECFMTGEVLQVNGGLTLRRNPTQQEINASMRAAKAQTTRQA
jgi:NAD(P)-dependent dehydrogenase (short-subunit alcohol dehydrogenase family)